MRFKEIAARLTGINCPVFGVAWSPSETQRTIAKRVITFLEDRRVLYVDSKMEHPGHCVESVLRIREFLTHELSQLGQPSEFEQSLRAMRAACRKFLDSVGPNDSPIIQFGAHRNHYASWAFNGALGEFRGVCGIHIAQIAVGNGLDVENDLASILPDSDEGT